MPPPPPPTASRKTFSFSSDGLGPVILISVVLLSLRTEHRTNRRPTVPSEFCSVRRSVQNEFVLDRDRWMGRRCPLCPSLPFPSCPNGFRPPVRPLKIDLGRFPMTHSTLARQNEQGKQTASERASDPSPRPDQTRDRPRPRPPFPFLPPSLPRPGVIFLHRYS